jgi:hypothetical protein
MVKGVVIGSVNSVNYEYDEDTYKAIFHTKEKNIDDLKSDTFIRGRTESENNVAYKINYPLNDGVTVYIPKDTVCGSDQSRTVIYWVSDYDEHFQCKSVLFKFPELDSFYRQNAKIDIGFLSYRKRWLKLSLEKDSRASIFRVCFVDEIVTDYDYLLDIYYCVKNLFAFLNNRKNIALNAIDLQGVNQFSESHLSRMTINDEFAELVENEFNTVDYPLVQTHFLDLVKLFLCNDDSKRLNSYSVHKSTRLRRLFDVDQCIRITSVFEYLHRKNLPTIQSAERDEVYQEIKDYLLEGYVKKLEGKKRRIAEDYCEKIRFEPSLKDKIQKAYKGYKKWRSLENILCTRFPIEEIEKLSDTANKWRNELAHDKRSFEPDESVCRAVRLVEHLNYCIVLRLAEYPDDEIRNIIFAAIKQGY